VETANQGALQAALGARYTLERELGRGGMATVYLARDLRHRRSVAVKVLHPELSAVLGPERFLREIELTANLQHPHILPLFDSGNAAGRLYYVMPYVDGETLRARLARERQLPVDDAARLAREVADALAYAHARGVIHRDVKPENVLLQGRERPHALVADFGIALAVEQAGGDRMTQTGLSLGTPQYMAPEQVTGERGVDARADVYALGAVLYEMLAGEPPFTGPTAQAVVAKTLTEEPKPLTLVRRSVPPHVETAVRRALEKLPADRFANAAAFADALTTPASVVLPNAHGARRAAPTRRMTVLLAFGALAVAALAWALGRASAGPPAERRPVRFTIELDSGILRFGEPAISPDGETIVYAAEAVDATRLYARRVDDISARPLAGTENAEAGVFSPDGAWVAFYSNGALRKARLDGSAAAVVTELPLPAVFAGEIWGPDDAIYYAVMPSGTVYRVPAAGGRPSRVGIVDSTVRLAGPRSLLGRQGLLVTVVKDFSYAVGQIGALDLASGRLRELGPGKGARYVAGTLVYAGMGGELYRQPFDVGRLEPTAAAEQVATGLSPLLTFGQFAFDASEAGALVYLLGPRRYSRGINKLMLFDSAGRAPRAIPARTPWHPRFAPDGRRIAHGGHAQGLDRSDVWVTDLETGATQRLTTDGEDNNDPAWSPDGTRIAYSRDTPRGKDVYVRALEGGPARVLVARPGDQWPTDWLRDGSLLFTEFTPQGDMDVVIQPADGGPAQPLLATPAQESGARISPDGHWVAYQSDESGRREVYVGSYPDLGRKALVSSGGGVNPVWRRDGRALYYWKVDQLMVAPVQGGRAGARLVAGKPTMLFRAQYVETDIGMYDVSPDGSRFIVVISDAGRSRLVVTSTR